MFQKEQPKEDEEQSRKEEEPLRATKVGSGVRAVAGVGDCPSPPVRRQSCPHRPQTTVYYTQAVGLLCVWCALSNVLRIATVDVPMVNAGAGWLRNMKFYLLQWTQKRDKDLNRGPPNGVVTGDNGGRLPGSVTVFIEILFSDIFLLVEVPVEMVFSFQEITSEGLMFLQNYIIYFFIRMEFGNEKFLLSGGGAKRGEKINNGMK